MSLFDEIKKALLASKNVNLQDSEGYTLLHKLLLLDTEADILPYVKLLVAAGANIDIRNQNSQTPFRIAKEKNQSEVLACFHERENIINILEKDLQQAARVGDSNTVKLLVECRPILLNHLENDPEKFSLGTTALSCAVENRHFATAENLLAMGAQIVIVRTSKNRHAIDRQDHALIRAFITGDIALSRLIYNAAQQQKIAVHASEILSLGVTFGDLESITTRSRQLVRMLLLVESHLTGEEAQAVVTRLYAINLKNDINIPTKSYDNIAAYGINRRFTFTAWQILLEQLEQFSKDVIALGLYEFSHWLIEQLFVHILDVNPHLADRTNLLGDVIVLLQTFSRKNKKSLLDDLFVALQTCYKFENIAPALLCLQQTKENSSKPPKALFKLPQEVPTEELVAMRVAASVMEIKDLPSLKRLKEQDIIELLDYLKKNEFLDLNAERKMWLAYFTIFRDRNGIRICHHILKNHEEYPRLLCLALEVLESVGVARLNANLENTEIALLMASFENTDNLAVKKQVLPTLWALSQDPDNAELRKFYALVLINHPQVKELVISATTILGRFNFFSNNEDDQEIIDLLCEQSDVEDEDIRYQTVLTLAKITDERALFTAKKHVQSPLWDRHAAHEGLETLNHSGSIYLFRKRPDEIVNNRNSMLSRIAYMRYAVDRKFFSPASSVSLQQLQSTASTILYSSAANVSDTSKEKNATTMLAEFCSRTFRCSAIPIYLPEGTTLLRALSIRKGITAFHESVRDLIRKGCGTSALSNTDAIVDGGTWNKIGHVFASPEEACFFSDHNEYFKESADGTLEETLLIAFSGDYYNHQLMRGEARMEHESTFNTVLYQGIPKQAIQAIYTPETLKDDLQLLAGNESVENMQAKLTSATFKDCSSHELKHFRRHLKASVNKQPFITRFHFFKVGVEKSENKSSDIALDNSHGSAAKQQVHEQIKKNTELKLVKRDEVIQATLEMEMFKASYCI